jgi:hypothetical protein
MSMVYLQMDFYDTQYNIKLFRQVLADVYRS